MIVAEECKAVVHIVHAATDEQYTRDALIAAREVVFLERVLTLLGTIQLGHKPDRPNDKFEYIELTNITDERETPTPSSHA